MKNDFVELRVSIIVDGKEVGTAPSINGELYRSMCKQHNPTTVKEETIHVMLADIQMMLEKILVNG
jgi:hypothetical protein